MPQLTPEQMNTKIREIEENCRKLSHIEKLGVENRADIAKILRILIGGIDNGDKIGLVERVRHLEEYQKHQEEKQKVHEKSFRNLKNTIIGGIIVGVFLTILNFASPVLQEYQTHALIEQLQKQGRLQTPEEKREQAREVAKEVIEEYIKQKEDQHEAETKNKN
jgi:aconitase B